MFHWLDAVDHASFVENLTRRDQFHPGATIHHLREQGLALFVSQGTIDLSRRLDGSQRGSVSDAFFLRILLHALEGRVGGDRITVIDVRDCRNLTDASINAIAANCPSLTELNTTGCILLTDEAIKAIAANCPSLTKLDVGGCSNLSAEAITAIAANCQSLKELKITGCRNITQKLLTTITTNYPSLILVT